MRLAVTLATAAAITVALLSAVAPARDSAPPQEIATAALPAEAKAMLVLIRRGGPYRYSQDDGVFGNREGLLPAQPRGYYREYTVAAPGAPNRGVRRIVAGGQPPEVFFYTDDHYRSFRRIRE